MTADDSRNSVQTVSTADVADLREHLASTRESYNDSMREMRKERLSWKADRMELQHMKSLLNDKNSTSCLQHLKRMVEEKAQHEEQMECFAKQIRGLKELVDNIRQENKGLRGQVNSLMNNNESAMIPDLEEQVNKWEALYFESAEIGSRRMEHLEQELDQVKESFQSTQETAEKRKEQVALLENQLQSLWISERAKNEAVKEYKTKSRARVVTLKEMLEHANQQAEQELLTSKHQMEDEISLLDTIEQLECQLNKKEWEIEKERRAAAERESTLQKQLKAAKKLAELDTSETDETTQIIQILAKKLNERLCNGILCCGNDEKLVRNSHWPRS
jgi:hypothetical protein